MLAGHFTTALIAKQQAPRGHIAYYLIASQLPDLLWLALFAWVGLEPTHPDNLMVLSLDNLEAELTYSHDLLPMLGWIALTIVVGRALFGEWRPGLVGGLLVVVHALTDYVAGYPHNLFGPDTHSVGTGLYYTAPYLAVTFEAVFTAVLMAWVLRWDAEAGIQRTRATWIVWALVFAGGVAFMFVSADLSMVEMTGLEARESMDGTTVPVMLINYLMMIGALTWAGLQPKRGTEAEDA